MPYENPQVSWINESTLVSDDEVKAVMQAVRDQVHLDFGPIWHTGARHVFGAQPGAWQMVILNDADAAGALGYHDLTPDGLPLSKVFVRTAQQDGQPWSIVASHEMLEMLADPWIQNAVQVGSSTFYALETADACEGQAYGYDRDGIVVSDFVTPRWFTGEGTGGYDFLGHITAKHQLLPGGYIGQWTPSSGWTQKLGEGSTGDAADLHPRHARRGSLTRA